MSKPSMYGRSIVGGLLFGKVGAAAGVLTAKQYEETTIVYTVNIWLKNGSKRYLRTEDPCFVDRLCAELEYIICQAWFSYNQPYFLLFPIRALFKSADILLFILVRRTEGEPQDTKCW